MEPTEPPAATPALSLRDKLARLQSYKKSAQKAVVESPPIIVPLRHSPGSAPLYLIHPIGGAVGCYFEFAKLVMTKSVYGIRSIGEKARGRRYRTVAEMAADYRQAIRHSDQQLVIGGWSFGGIVAYEIACQMQDTGLVRDLILIDPPLRFAAGGASDHAWREDREIIQALKPFLHDRAQVLGKAREFAALIASVDSDPDELLAAAAKCELIDGNDGDIATLLALFRENLELVRGYVPPKYRGKVVYVRGDPPDGVPDAFPSCVAPENVAVLPLAGGHYDLLTRDNARKLAAFIDAL